VTLNLSNAGSDRLQGMLSRGLGERLAWLQTDLARTFDEPRARLLPTLLLMKEANQEGVGWSFEAIKAPGE
jgi:hypothetical protein